MASSLILASGSSYKSRLLERLGVEFETLPANLDESAPAGESPASTAKRLAAEKATAVGDGRPGRFVLGADQTIALDGERFRKPGTPERAVDQLKRLSGRTHDLWCAVALKTPDGEPSVVSVHFEMVVRDLSAREIEAYVAEDSPLDCAGSYKVEAAGIRLFRAMRGDDHTAIVGLPLTRVWSLLERANYFEDR